MTKEKFLQVFYKRLQSDVYGAMDSLLQMSDSFDLSPMDKARFDVARHYIARPCFSNFVYLAKLLYRVINWENNVHPLFDFNPKVSPYFLSNLLTFISILDECKEDY